MHTLLYISLLFSAAALVSGNAMFFKAEAAKGFEYNKPNIILGPFFIPDKQCSGVVHNLTLACEYGLDSLQLTVVDGQGYPEVTIDNTLGRATVRRFVGPHGCVGRVTVQVTVGCALIKRRSPRALLDSLQAETPLLQSRQLIPMKLESLV